jgi:hypothetical protein
MGLSVEDDAIPARGFSLVEGFIGVADHFLHVGALGVDPGHTKLEVTPMDSAR